MYLPFPWETAKSTRTECTSYNNQKTILFRKRNFNSQNYIFLSSVDLFNSLAKTTQGKENLQ